MNKIAINIQMWVFYVDKVFILAGEICRNMIAESYDKITLNFVRNLWLIFSFFNNIF